MCIGSIVSAGNVGIGTTVTSSKLDIRAGSAVSPLYVSTSTTSGVVGLTVDSSNKVGINMTQPWANLHVSGGDSWSPVFRVDGSSHVIFAQNGNVGIRITTPIAQLHVFDAVIVGNPTGGNKGAGSINAVAVYDDNVLLTDYVFDKYFDGKLRKEDKEKYGSYEMLSLDQMITYMRRERHLPTMIGREEWAKKGKASVGQLVTQLWETVETQALYIKELKETLDSQKEALEELKKEIKSIKQAQGVNSPSSEGGR